MVLVQHGRVQGGGLVFSEPLTLPEGTEVVVRIEPATTKEISTPTVTEDFATLAFFGLWADREDMSDSVAWVQKERERWQERVDRQD
jgi:hypothetical protein